MNNSIKGRHSRENGNPECRAGTRDDEAARHINLPSPVTLVPPVIPVKTGIQSAVQAHGTARQRGTSTYRPPPSTPLRHSRENGNPECRTGTRVEG